MVRFNNNLISNQKNERCIVVGGGPNGLYAALLLLESCQNSFVHVIEKRGVHRPQVIRLPFSAIDVVPEKIKRALWPDARVRKAIFSEHSRLDPGFWPRCDYKYFPFVQVGEFQRIIKDYIEINYDDKRFKYEIDETFNIESLQDRINQYDLAIVTAGNGIFTKNLRKLTNISDLATDDNYRDDLEKIGVYMLFETDDKELYERCGQLMTGCELGAKGLTYAHSNDSSNHLQIYTYPSGETREIFAQMPESFKKIAAFRSSSSCLTLDGKFNGKEMLSSEEKQWLQVYSSAIKQILKKFEVPHPADDKIRVYYATRCEYCYDKAATLICGTPLLFVGDSAGGTDYKLGLSLGRGLITTMNLVHEMKNANQIAFKAIVEFFNGYWGNVVATEFNTRNMLLGKTAEIVHKYVMEGKVVDGKKIERSKFIKEYNRINSLL